MGSFGIASFVVSVAAWASYAWVNKIPALRRTMWPLWALFLVSVALAGAAMTFRRTSLEPDPWALGSLISLVLFLAMYFIMVRTTRAPGRPQAGQTLPAIQVLAETGQPIAPADFVGKGPLLLITLRGLWCISCCEELRNLAEIRKVLKAKGGDVLAVSTDPLGRLQQGRKDSPELECILASDEKGEAIQKLALVHESFSKLGRKIAVPANILIDRNGRIVWTHYATIAMDRPDPKDVLAQVEKVQ